MGSISKQLLLLLFPIMATCDPATSTNPITEKSDAETNHILGLYLVHMRIVNNLSDNQPLNVHCKSKDDDLNNHVIYRGQSFRWRFRPNIWGTTLFFCHFSWAGGEGSYDIYKNRRDYDRCKHACNWYVTQEGIEGYTEEDKLNKKPPKVDIFFNWQNP
ncbi:unnamed protein product [Sphenostylis stenocarpa]|uniref:S-protein homolog n=1 Tax=Sphenostylis stenocarpa TaxID=92480 RepID=A0AA87BAI1_9FABA|nr:unnamed protein product [Sphenostylis stenocarpa]